MKQATFVFVVLLVFVSADARGFAHEYCKTPDLQLGRCMPIEFCKPMVEFIEARNEISPALTSYLRGYSCGDSSTFRGGKITVCCPSKPIVIASFPNEQIEAYEHPSTTTVKMETGSAYKYCTTPDLQPGRCMPIGLCKRMTEFLATLNEIKPPLADYLRGYSCADLSAFRGSQTPVCCPPKPIKISSRITNPEDHSDHRNIHLLPKKCGIDPGQDRIHNGNETGAYEHPWAAALKMETGGYNCGGSVISERYVLTAAHCVQNDKYKVIGVRLGEHNFATEEDCREFYGSKNCAPPYEDFTVSDDDIIVHRDFTHSPLINDIALIRLKKPVNLTKKFGIAPLCLPITESEKRYSARIYTVIGWGDIGQYRREKVLMKTHVPKQSSTMCPTITFPDKQLCAGGVNFTDACTGDSGGPLMADFVEDAQIKAVQYGIVSSGSQFCAKEGHPTVYTNVAAYMDWILDNLKP